MSTTTIAPASTVATTALGPASARRVLARAEGRRLLRHPLFGLGVACTIFLMAMNPDQGDRLEMVSGTGFTFLGVGIWLFVVACLATSRERRDDAGDLYGAQPLSRRVRTEAALLSLGWAVAGGAVVTAAGAFALTGFDGAFELKGERYAVRPLELAQGPLYLAMMGALGVLVGAWSRHAYSAVVAALVLFMPPAAWVPWIVLGDDVPAGALYSDWLIGASVGWHLLGLAGLTALAAAGALARHDRRPRIALLALAGLGSAVAGIELGWPPGM